MRVRVLHTDDDQLRPGYVYEADAVTEDECQIGDLCLLSRLGDRWEVERDAA